jgi:FMN-dependent NADH-azoreductase
MLNFFGIEDYKCVSASKLDIIGMDVEAIVNKAIEEAKELAKSF